MPTPALAIQLVFIGPSDKNLPARLNMEIINHLQTVVYPEVFTPRAVYDGRKNLFAVRKLPLGDSDSREFSVSLSTATPPSPTDPGRDGGEGNRRGPKVYRIRLTHVAEINPEVLSRFLQGQQSHDNVVLTAITANIGGGMVLWRGYFQSVRPAVGRMLINVDISTGVMYKPGPLIDVALDFLGRPGANPNLLAPIQRFPDRERVRLQRFLHGVRITVRLPGEGDQTGRAGRVIRGLSTAGADALVFQREGQQITVAEYFRTVRNCTLRFPQILCVAVCWLWRRANPMEVCEIPPGQIMRKQLPPEKTKDVLDFSTKRPQDRLTSIHNALGAFQYGQSEYVRQSGMNVDTASGMLSLQARVLDPPTLQYGRASRQQTIKPRDGAWNMIDKKFYSTNVVERWVVVIYERHQRFDDRTTGEMIQGFLRACADVGIQVRETNPVVKYENAQGRISEQLRAAGTACFEKNGRAGGPNLIVVILPDGATDLYVKVKHFGDITMGVATQCMKSTKCSRAKMQYFANVCLKVNVKLGGINTIPDVRSVPFLTDPAIPTIVMGADVIHPAPGSTDRPSFTALVGNVDSDSAKYVADCQVQTGRQEMIADLEIMSQRILTMYMDYRGNFEKKAQRAPKRLIFFRDGVSEGQFRHVLEQELPLLQKACANLKINPTITMVVVGKRHHVRFFPQRPNDADRSGNCPAGTIVDREVVHPTEFDFYLQSHAPVYYADIVCSRAKIHYDPEGRLEFSDSATQLDSAQAERTLEAFRTGFKPLHAQMRKMMYFM
ncbi:Protein argonaute-2 [Grifola frondosa]|uniref:Protein argonaute-2 n=1 Tax=Grifola frondosa TaxID=5627 RepID=A0A1C7MGX3_GRIFR|nr:Protein argonaute-2 [Grifola frondosa]